MASTTQCSNLVCPIPTPRHRYGLPLLSLTPTSEFTSPEPFTNSWLSHSRENPSATSDCWSPNTSTLDNEFCLLPTSSSSKGPTSFTCSSKEIDQTSLKAIIHGTENHLSSRACTQFTSEIRLSNAQSASQFSSVEQMNSTSDTVRALPDVPNSPSVSLLEKSAMSKVASDSNLSHDFQRENYSSLKWDYACDLASEHLNTDRLAIIETQRKQLEQCLEGGESVEGEALAVRSPSRRQVQTTQCVMKKDRPNNLYRRDTSEKVVLRRFQRNLSAYANSQGSFVSSPEPCDLMDCASLPMEKQFSHSGVLYSLHSDSPIFRLMDGLSNDLENGQEVGYCDALRKLPYYNSTQTVLRQTSVNIPCNNLPSTRSMPNVPAGNLDLRSIVQCTEQACVTACASVDEVRQRTQQVIEATEQAERQLRDRLNRLSFNSTEETQIQKVTQSEAPSQESQVEDRENAQFEIDATDLVLKESSDQVITTRVTGESEQASSSRSNNTTTNSSENSEVLEKLFDVKNERWTARPEELPKLLLHSSSRSHSSSPTNTPQTTDRTSLKVGQSDVQHTDSTPWTEPTPMSDATCFTLTPTGTIPRAVPPTEQHDPENLISISAKREHASVNKLPVLMGRTNIKNPTIDIWDSPSLSLISLGLVDCDSNPSAEKVCSNNKLEPNHVMLTLSEPQLCLLPRPEECADGVCGSTVSANSLPTCLSEIMNGDASQLHQSIRNIYATPARLTVGSTIEHFTKKGHRREASENAHNSHHSCQTEPPRQFYVQPNITPKCDEVRLEIPEEGLSSVFDANGHVSLDHDLGNLRSQRPHVKNTESTPSFKQNMQHSAGQCNKRDVSKQTSGDVPRAGRDHQTATDLSESKDKTATRLRYVLLKHRLKLARAKDACRLRQRIVRQLEQLFCEMSLRDISYVPAEWDTDTSSLLSDGDLTHAGYTKATNLGLRRHRSKAASNAVCELVSGAADVRERKFPHPYNSTRFNKIRRPPKCLNETGERTHAEPSTSIQAVEPVRRPPDTQSNLKKTETEDTECRSTRFRLAELRNRAENQLAEMLTILKRKKPQSQHHDFNKSVHDGPSEPLPPPPRLDVIYGSSKRDEIDQALDTDSSQTKANAAHARASRGGLTWFEPLAPAPSCPVRSMVRSCGSTFNKPHSDQNFVADGKASACSGDNAFINGIQSFSLIENYGTHFAGKSPYDDVEENKDFAEFRRELHGPEFQNPQTCTQSQGSRMNHAGSPPLSSKSHPDGTSDTEESSLSGLIVTPRGIQFSIPHRTWPHAVSSKSNNQDSRLCVNTSLQSIFEQKMARWISRSRERQKRVKLASEHRKYTQAMNDVRLSLFDNSTQNGFTTNPTGQQCERCGRCKSRESSFRVPYAASKQPIYSRNRCCSSNLTRQPIRPTPEFGRSFRSSGASRPQKAVFRADGTDDGGKKPSLSKQRRINPTRFTSALEHQRYLLESKLAQLRVNRLRMKIYGEKVLRSVLQHRGPWCIPTGEL